MQYPITIVGGGIAGLYTAERLLEKGITPLLIESSGRLGGHVQTHYERTYHMEMCASRFNRHHKKVLALLQKHQLHISPMDIRKEYRFVSTERIVKEKDPSLSLLQTVLRSAENIPPSRLQKMSFYELCKQVVGKRDADTIIESFGYNAEFVALNALPAISIFREDFNSGTTYYRCYEGLSKLIERMEKNLKKHNVPIMKNHYLQRFEWDKNNTQFVLSLYDTSTNQEKKIATKKLVLALPKEALLQQPFFTKKQQELFQSVDGIPLHRIYMKYKTPWFSNLPRTSTNLRLRQFIPTDSKAGLVMVSYTDLYDADYWKKIVDMGEESLQKEIKNQLSQLFPEATVPVAPQKTFSYYWNDAIHLWKPNTNPEEVRKQLRSIHPCLFIVGESFSNRQGWMEGALETVDEVLPTIIMKGGKMLSEKELRSKFPNIQWLKLKLPNEPYPRIIDVSTWKNIHPGGAYHNLLYTDVSRIFFTKSVHFEGGNRIRPEVKNIIEKNTIGFSQR